MSHLLPDMSTLSPATAALLSRVMLQRQAAGLLVRWQLPDGSEWSAYAKDAEQKARWIEAKAAIGWVHLPD